MPISTEVAIINDIPVFIIWVGTSWEKNYQHIEDVRYQLTLVLEKKALHRSKALLLAHRIILRQSAMHLQLIRVFCAIITFQDFLCSQQTSRKSTNK